MTTNLQSQLSSALANPLLVGALTSFAEQEQLNLNEEIAQLAAQAARHRAQCLRERMGELTTSINESELRALLETMAQTALAAHESKAAAFAAYQDKLNTACYGLVFTAHPTFAHSQSTMRCLAELAADEDAAGMQLSAADREQRIQTLSSTDQRPEHKPTLELENQQAEAAITAARAALRKALRVLYTLSAEHFPEHWHGLQARLIDLATWVGGDMDGRNDIGWAQSLSLRWRTSAGQLHWLASELNALASWPSAALLQSEILSLALEVKQVGDRRAEQAHSLAGLDSHDAEAVSALGRAFNTAASDPGDVGLKQAWEVKLQKLLQQSPDLVLSIELASLLAEFQSSGLSSAHLHVRLNATQLHNALRHTLELEGEPTNPAFKRSALRKISLHLTQVQAIGVNFGNLMREQGSARRMFMQVAQLLKHCDGDNPIRFLIAESDSAFTVLAALYLAKRYGVEDRVDISPLFETPRALEHGAEIITELLANEDYRAYVRQRGRLCVQTGYSDAGRHLGQIASALAVERFQVKLAQVLARARLSGVELVLFNTHGESLGRGGHPGLLAQRWLYLYPPKARAAFAEAGIAVKHESSFQGGDGYVYFHTPALAFATLCRALTDSLTTPAVTPDSFYQDTDQSLDYFLALQDYNQKLMENPDFGKLLGHFGPQLLYATGSRQMVRQGESLKRGERVAAAQMRAIVQNAILQQLGWVATACFGVGAATSQDYEWFDNTLARSPRLQLINALARQAAQLGNSDILLAYLELYNPGFWLRLAPLLAAREQRAARYVARLLSRDDFYPSATRVAQRLVLDSQRLPESWRAVSPELQAVLTARDRLHHLRLSLIIKLFLHATYLPAFSSYPQIRVEDVMRSCLRLDLSSAVNALEQAFPANVGADDLDFGEGGDANPEDYDYRKEQEQLFAPLLTIGEQIQRISAALCHYYGAWG